MLLEMEIYPEKYERVYQVFFSSKPHTKNKHTPITFGDSLTMTDDANEANLVVAIYDSPANGIIKPMDKTKYDRLFESINDTLFSEIDKYNVIPTFVFNQYVRGVMRIKCATHEAKSWLSNMIRYTAPLWQNMQLKVADFDKLPPQNRVFGLFPYCKLNAEQIHRILIAMNPQLNVECWTILGSKTIKNVVRVAFGIDELQMDMLGAHNFRLYFGAGYVRFRDISKDQAGPWFSDAEGVVAARTLSRAPSFINCPKSSLFFIQEKK